MTNWDILNQDKAENEGTELANKHLNMVKNTLKEIKNSNPDERKIYELSIKEFKELMVDCFEMLKQRELDKSMEEYKRLKRGIEGTSEVFVKGGEAVPQEF